MARLSKTENIEEEKPEDEVIEMGMTDEEVKKEVRPKKNVVTEICKAKYFDNDIKDFVYRGQPRGNFNKVVDSFYEKVK